MNIETILTLFMFAFFGGFTVYLIREKASSWVIAIAVAVTIANGSIFLNKTVGIPLNKIVERIELIEQAQHKTQQKMSPYNK